MILSAEEIKEAIEREDIRIDPAPDSSQYSSTSLDMRLGEGFYRWNEGEITKFPDSGITNIVDPSRMRNFSALSSRFLAAADVDAEGCHVIHPRDFVLALTHEWVELPLESGIAARVEGRSSLARMGLSIHLTAPTIQAGWSGPITLEIVNLGPWPIKLRPHELKICQLILERVGQPGAEEHVSQFHEQTSPSGP